MAKNLINERFLRQLWIAPELAIEKLNLIYASDDELKIKRKKKSKHFIYEYKGGLLNNEEELKRIKNLVIPPAWENVLISYLPNTHLQATGRDEKKRKQYRYHPVWNKVRNQTKFYRMLFFGDVLPLIREQIDLDLNQKGWPKTKTLALVLKLMEETHIRVGNEQYAKRNKTYGLSTLRTKHINITKDKLKFQFTGKKGKKHKVTVRNKKLRFLVNKCLEIPGWELFKYYDKKGEKHTVDSSMINNYIFKLSNEHFTAKDFRTWAASVIFFNTLYDLGIVEEEKQQDKNILTAYDVTAKALGNTRNVCRKYYVHPIIPKSYKDQSIMSAFKIIDDLESTSPNFSETERALMHLLENFKPDLKF